MYLHVCIVYGYFDKVPQIHSAPEFQDYFEKRILSFTFSGKRTNVPFTWSFASERNILQKAEAVGITYYKDGI